MKRVCVAAVVVMLFVTQPAPRAQSGGEHWVGTWSTAVVVRLQGPAPPPAGPQPCFLQTPPTATTTAEPAPATTTTAAATPPGGGRAGPPPAPVNFNNQTLRQIVHVSLGGERIRVVVSNAFGTAPLALGAAHVALREKDAAIVATSGRALTFGGSPTINIPPGSSVISDPVALTVPPLADLAIDLYLPGDTSTSPLTTHAGALQTNYVMPGNTVGASNQPDAATRAAWFFLARVEVAAPASAGAVVTIGDSITDGTRSTANANNRWPDILARRLQARNARMGVLNLGIGGNRVLGDGAGVSILARFDRDVLAQAGATHVIVMEGINDIGGGRSRECPSADDLIAAHRQLIERAHARGLRILGATLTPFDGAAYWTAEGEAKRQALNTWIRTGKAYDGVVDFDAAVRDSSAPTKIKAEFDPGDHLHFTDAGYQAMGNAIDLALFKRK